MDRSARGLQKRQLCRDDVLRHLGLPDHLERRQAMGWPAQRQGFRLLPVPGSPDHPVPASTPSRRQRAGRL